MVKRSEWEKLFGKKAPAFGSRTEFARSGFLVGEWISQFVFWLINNKGYSASEVSYALEKLWKYDKELEEFMLEYDPDE
tara:strand:- start:246 stop:482 length:237 start_codon:yes stop_codon:yes gene_type:complete